MSTLNFFLFSIYPYIAVAVLLIGSWYRYDYGQYTWRTGSSQLLDKKGTVLALNLFHIGLIGVFFGHIAGLLTPRSWYEAYVSDHTHQVLALFFGTIFGSMLLIGALMLLYRRFFNPRISATSTFADKFILVLLVIQIGLGMAIIPYDMTHMSGDDLQHLISWCQGIFMFEPHVEHYLNSVNILFKLHIVLGLTIFTIFPFTRLVHMWSIPFGYIKRRRQVVR
ncbi:respiratory nitrate reductase, gamma subunit [Shewanella halifaxensis HAW-EB4]|uniref:nitrate reductase (quinone) n=1 Tax=Shewanella halifaxensis (strain HAW-EB4) TaxID=458817 RepID=B0TSN5_SHEHH|nr:respiratory nitrate reductase subunit gamma [Shewanella halifaxensis]ABZ77989.1 respiratory nitrate reductase, gamma subunit [Shewanella halifaxensis HAW-EB4]